MSKNIVTIMKDNFYTWDRIGIDNSCFGVDLDVELPRGTILEGLKYPIQTSIDHSVQKIDGCYKTYCNIYNSYYINDYGFIIYTHGTDACFTQEELRKGLNLSIKI